MKLIDKDKVVAELERLKSAFVNERDDFEKGYHHGLDMVLYFLNTIEVKEVDMEKLGEVARHLIAVKEHIEDMRLYTEEWFMLEKIGYPERFKVQKGE